MPCDCIWCWLFISGIAAANVVGLALVVCIIRRRMGAKACMVIGSERLSGSIDLDTPHTG
jgi:hypothetical protein